jgi:hypothetical protein
VVGLAHGDAVVFYSDGAIERRGVPLDASLARLPGQVDAFVRGRLAPGVAARLADGLADPPSRFDDVTTLVLWRHEEPAAG